MLCVFVCVMKRFRQEMQFAKTLIYTLDQRSPTFLAPGTGFMEGSLSMVHVEGYSLEMI